SDDDSPTSENCAAKLSSVRGFRGWKTCGESAVSVLAKTVPGDDRSADICSDAAYLVPQLQNNAASATWQNTNVGKVRSAAL
ncbi:MAG: hypothetical protein ABJU19_22695, partial [Roseobacter sp.]